MGRDKKVEKRTLKKETKTDDKEGRERERMITEEVGRDKKVKERTRKERK